MRPLAFLVLALAALALAAVPAEAQPPTFSQAYQVRAAHGDIPSTPATEPDDGWNIEQRLTVQFTNTTAAQHGFVLPEGSRLLNASCTCNPSQSTATEDAVVFTLDTSVPSGSYTLTVLTAMETGRAFGFTLMAPIAAGPADRIAVIYVPNGWTYVASAEGSSPGLSTDGSSRIVSFESFESPLWVAVHLDDAATGTAAPDSSWSGWIVPALLGLLVGIVLWAVLVSRGAVQAKSRRQVAGTAAHVEAAATDPPAVLEGRKRALLAALKEIEVARMNNEMAQDVYDAVKADLKRQAVTVMRALEAAPPADAKA